MARKDRAARERKRQARLARQKSKKAKQAKLRRRQDTPTTYEGRKYQKPRYTLAIFRAEHAVFCYDAEHDFTLTDAEVRRALEGMILNMRARKLRFDADGALVERRDLPIDPIEEAIERAWRHMLQTVSYTQRELTGVLRTIVSSLDLRTSHRPDARGYLDFLTEFIPKLSSGDRGESENGILHVSAEGISRLQYGDVEVELIEGDQESEDA